MLDVMLKIMKIDYITRILNMKESESESHSVVSNSLWPHGL